MTQLGGPPPGHILPQSDGDRVLGQIERGEIWCGPDAARAIAARHQAAYGDVWDDAWADALGGALENS